MPKLHYGTKVAENIFILVFESFHLLKLKQATLKESSFNDIPKNAAKSRFTSNNDSPIVVWKISLKIMQQEKDERSLGVQIWVWLEIILKLLIMF